MRRLLGGFAVFALAAPLLASESFVLNIPIRGIQNQETGEVRITLVLSAAPQGAQLVVGGAVTLNLGNTQTVAGDSVSFQAGIGNEARIVYKPLSNFGVDFCDGAAAQEKNISMRFAGAQDITAYRMSSYAVAAPLAECSGVSKHVGDAPASLIPTDDGVAPALNAVFTGRDPFDVVLVLDKSGSMADLPPGANIGPKKIDILKSAVQAFVAQWEQIDAPFPGGKDDSHDRLGLVFFDSAAQSQTLPGADPPANFFLQRGNSTAWNAVINASNALVPGSSTTIGGGVNEGMKQWKADPANDLQLVVVTDGMQNTAPLIQPTNTGFLGLAPVSGFPQELRKRFVPIQTIAFGSPAQVDEQLLKNISLETSGVTHIAVNSATMWDVFGMTLVAILKGNTASIGTRFHDTMSGTGPGAARPVIVDDSAQRVVFTLQWDPPGRDLLDLEVFRPGSIIAAIPSSTKKTAQASLQTFNLKPGDGGTWTVRVRRAKSEPSENVPYAVSAMFLEKHLDHRLSFDNIHPITGDKLGIRAVVALDGKPLTGLPAGAIRLRVLRAPEALGTILHQIPFTGHVPPVRLPAGGEPQTPYDLKVAAMTNEGFLKRIIPAEVATIEMKEEGRGVYSAAYDQTQIPGTYAFEALLDWTDKRTGHTHREERIEEFVKAQADPAKTEIKLASPAPGTVVVSVTPRDRFGNFLGPRASVAGALRSEGRLTGPVDADVTGTFVFTITGVPAGTTPDLRVSVDGVVVLGGRER